MSNCPRCNEPLPLGKDACCPDCINATVDLNRETATRDDLPQQTLPELATHDSALHRRPIFVKVRPPRSNASFWMSAWFGTIMAGGLFGFGVGVRVGEMEFAFYGLITGCLIAGLLGAPIQSLAAFFVWFFWLSRFRIAVASFAGLITGVIATLASENIPVIASAGLLGMFGSGLAGARYWRLSRDAKDANSAEQAAQGPWQFTLRDLFLRITVVSVLLAAGLALIRALFGD